MAKTQLIKLPKKTDKCESKLTTNNYKSMNVFAKYVKDNGIFDHEVYHDSDDNPTDINGTIKNDVNVDNDYSDEDSECINKHSTINNSNGETNT